MRTSPAILLGLALASCAGSRYIPPERPSKNQILVTPAFQLAKTGQRVCAEVFLLGPLNAGILEVWDEDPTAQKVVSTRTVVRPDGSRAFRACAKYSAEYYEARVLNALEEQRAWKRGVPLGDIGRLPRTPDVMGTLAWDGTIHLELVWRAPRPDDFQHAWTKDDLTKVFGRADGHIYARRKFRIRLSCPPCQV